MTKSLLSIQKFNSSWQIDTFACESWHDSWCETINRRSTTKVQFACVVFVFQITSQVPMERTERREELVCEYCRSANCCAYETRRAVESTGIAIVRHVTLTAWAKNAPSGWCQILVSTTIALKVFARVSTVFTMYSVSTCNSLRRAICDGTESVNGVVDSRSWKETRKTRHSGKRVKEPWTSWAIEQLAFNKSTNGDIAMEMTLASRKPIQSDKTIPHGMDTIAPIVTMTGTLVWTESDTKEH